MAILNISKINKLIPSFSCTLYLFGFFLTKSSSKISINFLNLLSSKISSILLLIFETSSLILSFSSFFSKNFNDS